MPVTAVPRSPEVDALLAKITRAKILVGDAIRPVGGGFPNEDTSQPFVAYAVLYPGVTTQIDGPVADPNADVIAEYQLTSIGVTRKSASVISDLVKAAILGGTPLAIPNRFVQLVEWTSGHPASRDDAVTPPLFYAIDIYAICSSPA
jgi:hypothetical protein